MQGYLALPSPWQGAAFGPIDAASLALNDAVFGVALGIGLIIALSFIFGEQKSLMFAFSALFIALFLGYSFKAFFQEPRPCKASFAKIPCPDDYALPSLHALLAFTAAIVFVGSRSFPFYLIFALFVAFSRVYLGVHTPMQVAASLPLAFFACVLAELMFLSLGWEIPRSVHIKRKAEGLA